MAASCLVMTKLNNEASKDTVNPTKLFVSTGMFIQQFADESVWTKILFHILCLRLAEQCQVSGFHEIMVGQNSQSPQRLPPTPTKF